MNCDRLAYFSALCIHYEVHQPTSSVTGRPHPQTPAASPHLDGLLACLFPRIAGEKSVLSLSLSICYESPNMRVLLFAGVKGRYPASHRDPRNALSGYQETQLPSWGSSFFLLSVFWISSRSVVYKLFLTALLHHVLSRQAFTTDFRVHWAQHPLRPEFAESTYFLYKVQLSSRTNLNITYPSLSIIFLLINLKMWPPSHCIAPAEVHSTVYFNVVIHGDDTND